jgi:hypothetical protein
MSERKKKNIRQAIGRGGNAPNANPKSNKKVVWRKREKRRQGACPYRYAKLGTSSAVPVPQGNVLEERGNKLRWDKETKDRRSAPCPWFWVVRTLV